MAPMRDSGSSPSGALESEQASGGSAAPRGRGRCYVTAALTVPERRTVELRYEALVADPDHEANRLSAALTVTRQRWGAPSQGCM